MPGWNLADLYPEGGAQLNADLEQQPRTPPGFRETYAGKLDGLARADPAGLAKAIAPMRRSPTAWAASARSLI